MIIDLESVFNVEGMSVDISHEADYSAEELDGVFPFTAPVCISGRVANETGIVTIDADVSLELKIPCSRCAREFTMPLDIPVFHTLVREVANEDNDELICVSDSQFDVDPLIKEDVFLSLPFKFLCSEDCKGLCPKCGRNLNDGPCSCEPETDPRLDVLRQLLDN